MPISTIPPSHAEIVLRGLINAGGSTAKNTAFVFHFARASNTPPLNAANVETAFNTAITPSIAAALNLRWAQTQNDVRFPDDATSVVYTHTRTTAGVITGDSMSTVLSAYLLMRTGLRGKHYRGSKHFGPLSESDTTAGADDILNAAAVTRFTAIATAIQAGFTDSDGNVWAPVVLSKSLSQLRTNPTTIVSTFVTQILVNQRIGRMRRREVKSVY